MRSEPVAVWGAIHPSPMAQQLAEAVSSLSGVVVALAEPALRRVRRIAGAWPEGWGPTGRGRWPTCLSRSPLSPSRLPCADGGLHLASPVARSEAFLITGEIAGARVDERRLNLCEHLLQVISDEVARSFERDVPASIPQLVGASAPFEAVRALIAQACAVRYPLVVQGETGTGKDVVATLVHRGSERAQRPFLAINCAALPDQLLESELFGCRRGAFSGADRDRTGLLEAASGGTLFLDEIQQMSLAAQAKLLRAVETGECLPLGATRPVHVDVRVIAATNADLAQLVATGGFRRDLYYRLSVLTVQLPALREVRSDIPAIVAHLLRAIGEERNTGLPATISGEAMSALMAAPWPGNVRQLRHALERALLQSGGAELRPPHLSGELQPLAPRTGRFTRMRDQLLEAWEREEIGRGLERTGWNVSQLAQELGLSRRGLTAKIARLSLVRPGSALPVD